MALDSLDGASPCASRCLVKIFMKKSAFKELMEASRFSHAVRSYICTLCYHLDHVIVSSVVAHGALQFACEVLQSNTSPTTGMKHPDDFKDALMTVANISAEGTFASQIIDTVPFS